MNKPASELIALASLDRVRDALKKIELASRKDSLTDHERLQSVRTIVRAAISESEHPRTAANQSASERAGVDALREALERMVYLYESEYDADAPFVRPEWLRSALATPPAQPAPSKCEDCSGSGLALNSAGEPDICKTCGGNTVVPHGKPDGAVREAVCCSAISPCEYQRTHRTGVCETCQKAAALSPKIATAETSPGDVIAMKEVLGHIRTAILEARLEVVTDTLWMPERLSKNETVVDYIAAAIARLDVKAEAKSQEPEAYLADDRMAQIDYSVDLQRIIEDLCRDRPIREPKTGARYHYDMAVAHHPTTKPEAPAVSVDAIKRDAERYRLIRNRNSPLEAHANDEHLSAYHIVGGVRELKWGDNLDRAIDAALIAGGR